MTAVRSKSALLRITAANLVPGANLHTFRSDREAAYALIRVCGEEPTAWRADDGDTLEQRSDDFVVAKALAMAEGVDARGAREAAHRRARDAWKKPL